MCVCVCVRGERVCMSVAHSPVLRRICPLSMCMRGGDRENE